jgi:hypothetical protein
VRAGPFEARTIEGHQPFQARFVEHDHVIEALTTGGTHKSLDEWILPRRVGSREHFINPHRLCGGLEAVECMVAIVDQISRRFVPRKRLTKLLGRPRRRRIRGDRHVPDASPIVGEEHQDEQETVGRSRDHEEIGRHDLADVIPQEGALCLRRRLARAHHVFRDGRLTDVDSEFQQFAVDPRRAPTRVRLGHCANQRPDVGGHRRPPDASAAPPCPPESEASSVPGDDRLDIIVQKRIHRRPQHQLPQQQRTSW